MEKELEEKVKFAREVMFKGFKLAKNMMDIVPGDVKDSELAMASCCILSAIRFYKNKVPSREGIMEAIEIYDNFFEERKTENNGTICSKRQGRRVISLRPKAKALCGSFQY